MRLRGQFMLFLNLQVEFHVTFKMQCGQVKTSRELQRWFFIMFLIFQGSLVSFTSEETKLNPLAIQATCNMYFPI